MSGMYRIHRATGEVSIDMIKLIGKGSKLTFKLLFNELSKLHPYLSPQQARARLSYYQKNNLITGTAKSGFQLSKDGVNALELMNLHEVRQESSWDGKWRIIAFDIPEINRTARHEVRRLIRELGCHQLQKSIWIHPLPCLKQFQAIQQAYGLENHILLMEISWIDNQKNLLQIFEKTYPNLKTIR